MYSLFKLDQKGVSILELAIVLPLLTILVFGALEIGLKINSLQMVSAAAQEGVKVAASYKPPAIDICPDPTVLNPTPVSVVCPNGAVEAIPLNSDLGTVAQISTCNYLKQQNMDAEKWLITTTVRFTDFEGKSFPIIDLRMQEQDPECTLCIDNLVSIIPADSEASMSLQNCEAI